LTPWALKKKKKERRTIKRLCRKEGGANEAKKVGTEIKSQKEKKTKNETKKKGGKGGQDESIGAKGFAR